MSLTNIYPRILAVLAITLAATAIGGCSTQTGQYAPAKQQWDSPRPAQLQDELRMRLELTQHDH